MTDWLDRNAVLTGALWCVLIATPAAVASGILADTDERADQSAWVIVAFAVIAAAYLIGGAQAGRRAPTVPFINGSAAAVLAFTAVQSVAAIVRLARGDSVSPLLIVFNALLAASIGALGAGWGARRATMVVDGELPG